MKIADVHRQQVATIRPTASLRKVAHLMEETGTGIVVVVDPDDRRMLAEGMRRLPVVSGDELVGVVSMRDLFALETFMPAPM